MTDTYCERRKGFTLIELLVVIAVIALLMAVLTPALKKAKMSAKKIICKANLHSWGTVVNSYAESENQKFPRQDIRVSGMNAWDVSNRLVSFDRQGKFGHYTDGAGNSNECVTYDYGIEQEEFIWCPMIPAKEKDVVKAGNGVNREGEDTNGFHSYNLWIGYNWWVPRGAENNNDGKIDPKTEMFPWDSYGASRRLLGCEGAASRGANHPIMTDVVLRLPPDGENLGLTDNPPINNDILAASVNYEGFLVDTDSVVFGFHGLNGYLRDMNLLYGDAHVDTKINNSDGNIRPRFYPVGWQYRNFY